MNRWPTGVGDTGPYSGPMHVESDDAAGPQSSNSTRQNLGWVAGTLLLLFVGLPLSLYLMLPLGLSGRGCGFAGLALVCSPTVALTIIYLPLIGLLLALICSVVGGLRRRSRGASPGRAALVGWAVFVVFEAALLLIAR